MSKWPDYAITAVRYDGNTIERVRVYEGDGAQLTDRQTRSRTALLLSLFVQRDYCTAYQTGNGEWRKGADVETVDVAGTTYIRTDGNDIASDDLGELPDF